MALTLNGSTNTIAGLAVGGLPDGIVDTDMLAANAVTSAKAANSLVGYVKLADHAWDSAVSSVDVDSLDTSTYKYFKLLWNCVPTDDGEKLYFRWRKDSTTQTAGTYDWSMGRYYGTTNYGGENTAKVEITAAMGDDTNEGFQGEFTIYPKTSVEKEKHGNAVFWNGIYFESPTYARGISGSGFYDGGTTYYPNGFTLYMSSGNMDSGNYSLYGVKR